MNWIVLGFAVYAVTLVITASHIMKPLRWAVRVILSHIMPVAVRESLTGFILDDPEDGDGGEIGYDFITCAMCVGFWVTAGLYWFYGVTPFEGIAAYGLSYFLKTQERP